MSRISIEQIDEAGCSVLHLEVLDQAASLQDVMDAWQPLCDDEGIFKKYASGHYAACRGCTLNCCNAADITPDLISFKKMASLLKMDYRSMLKQFYDPVSLQAGLIKMKSNPCVFLEEKCCSIYPVRSLLCRFYLCTELSGSTQELLYRISLLGSVATQQFALQESLVSADAEPHAGFDLMVWKYMQNYQSHPAVRAFQEASNYCELPISLFL